MFESWHSSQLWGFQKEVSLMLPYRTVIIIFSPLDRGRAASSMIDTFFTMINASELEEETLKIVVDTMLEDPSIRGFLSRGGVTEKVLGKLGNPTPSSRRAALSLVVAFSKNVEVCVSIITEKKIFRKIGSLLMDSDADVQEGALKAISASSQNPEARELILSTTQTIKNVIRLLDHGGLSISKLAFDTVESFLSEDRVINMIAIPETMFKVLSKLGDTEQPLREGALSCLLKMVGHVSRIFCEQNNLYSTYWKSCMEGMRTRSS
ncbi:hypothetical protein B0H16DRAFT_739780 [Mycena metata]|uniref:Uncharacterized protein n=1 Tax=Mycena metata TaxID=1033252 RepID=A0AAD7E017_9AGAR|nr:hypothetical protein B0H16DRAFT_739780 [Mycena metata]